MARPDIKTYHANWRENWITPITERPNFMGRNDYDIRWKKTHPPVNLKKSDEIFEMEIAVPGFTKKDLKIEVKDDLLIIQGERLKKESYSEKDYILREFENNTLRRVFKLAKGIGHEKITATCENGILRLTFIDVPKEEENTHKKVFVL